MRLISFSQGVYSVELTEKEIVTFSNCLNEALGFISRDAFHPRIGSNQDDAERLLDNVTHIIASCSDDSDDAGCH